MIYKDTFSVQINELCVMLKIRNTNLAYFKFILTFVVSNAMRI
jgi:hypothetical protein